MKLKILLVDDDVDNSMLLKSFIEYEGYDVIYAGDGVIGWELYCSEHPHLALLDINMPGLNGFDLAKKIRQNDKETIIFFLSDRTTKEDRLTGFNLECNDYIPKPFYPEELIARIQERVRNLRNKDEVVFQIGNTLYNSNLSTISMNGKEHILSGRQNEILFILAKNIGEMVSRDTILNQIWGDDSFANSLSLNVQMNYLRKALSQDPSVSIKTLRNRGFVLTIAVNH